MLQGYYCDDSEVMFPNTDNDPNFNEWVSYAEADQRIKALEAGQLDFAKEITRIHKTKIQRIKALEKAIKDVCDVIHNEGTVSKWKIANWLEHALKG